VTLTEVIFCFFLAFMMALEEILAESILKAAWLFWNVSALILSLILVVALRKLRQWQNKVSGVFCNERLMKTHQIAFCVATTTSLAAYFLFLGSISKTEADTAFGNRLSISSLVLLIVSVPFWNLVQFLILYVFFRYGKPLEDDAKLLITNKLIAVQLQEMADQADEELMFERRMEAYRDIADRQLQQILRSILSYSTKVAPGDRNTVSTTKEPTNSSREISNSTSSNTRPVSKSNTTVSSTAINQMVNDYVSYVNLPTLQAQPSPTTVDANSSEFYHGAGKKLSKSQVYRP